MGEVIPFERWRNIRFARELDRMEASFDARIGKNPHSPVNVPSYLQPGRDAGSLGADEFWAQRHARANLIDFAKTGAPPKVPLS